MPSSSMTTSSTASKLIFTGCSTSGSSATSSSTKCGAFHFHRRFNPLRYVHVCPYKTPRIVFTHTANPPSFVAAAMAPESSAEVIDGKKVAKEISDEVAAEVSNMKEAISVVPGLAVILVGDRKDSATYVCNKKKACEDVGIRSFEARLPEDSTEEEVLKHISGFNNDPAVHGILVQLPLPSHVNEQNVLNAVCIEKDVDGFHPLNIGCLAMRGREPLFVPCTPKGQ